MAKVNKVRTQAPLKQGPQVASRPYMQPHQKAANFILLGGVEWGGARCDTTSPLCTE